MKPAMDHDERDEVLERMGRLARGAFSDSTRPVASAAGKRQLKLALNTNVPRRPVMRWAAVAAAALVVVAALLVYRGIPSHLAYEIEGASPSDGGYLQGTKKSPAVAHFTDGTQIRIDAGARARIVEVDAHGARVALEQGRAHLRVVHRPRARWSVDAGPFSIAVTGTEFDADWSAADGVLVVEMHSGAVIVRGPLAADGVGVRGGQRLIASVPEGRLHIESLAVANPVEHEAPGAAAQAAPGAAEARQAEPPTNRPAETQAPAPARGDDADDDGQSVGRAPELDDRPPEASKEEHKERARWRRSGSATHVAHSSREDAQGRNQPSPPAEPEDEATVEPAQPPAMSWSKRVASGDFRGVIADAEDRGLGATLSEAPLGDLVALSDAARYTGNSSLARDALVSQRKRYPSSADAKNAAFLLGRIAEGGGATGEAIDWYERYLSEAPRGAFAAEALGREMLATGRSRGPAAAAEVARKYLQRFPGGPYADQARKLAAGP